MRLRPLLCSTGLLLAACSDIAPTTSLPRVQTEFEQAFHTDRLYSGRISAAPSGYQAVMSFLSKEGIAKLEPGQRPNAWMMRAISEWRNGQHAEAKASASSGLASKPAAHSREQVLMTMLPALITDSEVISAWRASGMRYSAQQYATVESSYLQAMQTLDAAEAAIDKTSTPEPTRSYFAYQKWRLLFNWETIISTLNEGKTAAEEATSRLKPHFAGHDLLDVADAVRKTVPAGDPYRAIMDAEMGRH